MCSNWACTESVRGEVSDGLPYLDPFPSGTKKGTGLSTDSFGMLVTRFELATFWSVARRSIQLSYTNTSLFLNSKIYYSVREGKCQ